MNEIVAKHEISNFQKWPIHSSHAFRHYGPLLRLYDKVKLMRPEIASSHCHRNNANLMALTLQPTRFTHQYDSLLFISHLDFLLPLVAPVAAFSFFAFLRGFLSEKLNDFQLRRKLDSWMQNIIKPSCQTTNSHS